MSYGVKNINGQGESPRTVERKIKVRKKIEDVGRNRQIKSSSCNTDAY